MICPTDRVMVIADVCKTAMAWVIARRTVTEDPSVGDHEPTRTA
jgi:hypothetical protein